MNSIQQFSLLLLLLQNSSSLAWLSSSATTTTTTSRSLVRPSSTSRLFMSDWSNFQSLDDDDDLLMEELGRPIDTKEYAVEDDSQERKAQVGASLDPPEIDDPYWVDPIQVPAGSQLELSEETVIGVLNACRTELGTLFGYSAENRGVGITGGVDYVDLDGPMVVISLKGRFWHERTTVLDRVSNYLIQRIPEIIEVNVQDPWQLTQEANEVF